MKFSRSPLLSERLPLWRQRTVLVLLLGAFATLIGRSLYLQGFNNEFLGDKGRARFERVIDISATRGRITDRYGDVLAVSTPVRSIWAIPEDAQPSPAQARSLAKLLEMDVREVNRKLASEKDFVYVKRQLPPQVADSVSALKLAGIHQKNEYRRYYPAAEVTSHMLGFTGADDAGQEGIELALNAQLAGKSGSRRVIKDRRGNVVEDVESVNQPLDGKDVVLALDSKIQYLAYSHLNQAVMQHRAKAAGIVVIDVRTGEILALANLPSYNPNNRYKLAGAQLRNRALTDSFEPGSTLKPFTAALAIEKGKVRFNTPIQTSPGKLTIGSATISDTSKHGQITVAQVIQKSSNVGIAKIALSMSPGEMWSMFDGLGFGAALKLGFPGEVGGRLRPAKKWRPIEQATMAYGHGISVTLIQLAHAYMAFARDGDLLPLSLTRVDAPTTTGKQVFSAQTAREVRAMLEMVVQPGGTAPLAHIPGYRVAGKTGTAHKVEDGVYAKKYVASFVGFAPVSEPRLIIAVMIDEPSSRKHFGGEVAAPVFADVMAGSLRSLGVAPDAPMKPLIMTSADLVQEEM
ncbi:MAG: penicillin-binding protein 2 [Sulfuritalea sp.]|nr:penicillin-binding protein 2 [Sulfuritalea sp.]